MNVILLEDPDFVGPRRVRLSGGRLEHVRGVLRAAEGDRLLIGRVDGKLGYGTIIGLTTAALELEVELDREPPAPSPVVLAVALPRPPTLRKVLQQATSMGVKRIVLFHAARVEKSYWSSSVLEPESLRRQLCLGLEQARDTVLPQVDLARRFRPFAEDALPRLAPRTLVGDVEADQPCPIGDGAPTALVIGPEGGLVEFERDLLREMGAMPVGLGVRPLRVETAVVAALGRLGAP